METKEVNVRGRRNERVGYVTGDGADKTITVQVYWHVRHPRYGKFVRRVSKFMAHDEKNEARIGDKVSIFETRPLSKRKRWKLDKIIESATKQGETQ